jgi:Mg-chelatase subunit ChlD
MLDRRSVRGVIACLLSLVVVAGCSGDGDPDEQPPSSAPTGSSSATPGSTPSGDSVESAFDALVASNPGPEEPDGEAVYRLAVAENAVDLSACAREASDESGSCKRPASLKRDLKATVNVAIVVDASGSMRETIGGSTKMDLARAAISEFVGTLPPAANVSLRVFGNGADEPKSVSCASQTRLLPFGAATSGKVSSALGGIPVQGYTPLAGALEAVSEDFASRPAASNSNFVYVVSDGEETCDGDPVAQARKLAGSAIDVQVNLIGFSVDSPSARQLKRTAEAGGGVYADARDGDALDAAFKQVGDWAAWTAYYNCRYSKAQSQFLSDWVSSADYTICLNNAVTDEKLQLNKYLRTWGEQYQSAYQGHLDALQAEIEQEPDDDRRRELERLLSDRRSAYNDAYGAVTETYNRLSGERFNSVQKGIRDQHAGALVTAEEERDAALAEVEELRRKAGLGTTTG